MQRWNWFLAADLQGKWIITDGQAEVMQDADGKFSASLRITPETPVYHHLSCRILDGNRVESKVTSPDRDVPSFELYGYLFEGQTVGGVETKTIILTDGATVIGLCFGPRSHEKNF